MRFPVRLLAVAVAIACACAPAYSRREPRDLASGGPPPANPAEAAGDLEEGHRLFRLGQYTAALEKVNGILAVRPRDPQARFLKGWILSEQGHDDAAARIYNGLTDEYPGNLAVLYAGEGHYDKAREALEVAVHPRPGTALEGEQPGGRYLARMIQDGATRLYDGIFGAGTGASSGSGGDGATATVAAPPARVAAPATPPVRLAAKAIPPVRTVAAVAPPAPVVVAVPAPPSVPAQAPAQAPILAAAPPPAPPPAREFPPGSPAEEAFGAIRQWASAWSAKDSSGYLALYAPDFAPASGESRAAWEAQRRERIAAPDFIQVAVDEATARTEDERNVVITFRQSYRASHHEVVSLKTLKLVKVGGRWLIASERSGA